VRLRHLTLQRYRGFESAELTFPEGNLCLLIGRNGAGKSSALAAMAGLLASVRSAALRAHGHPNPPARPSPRDIHTAHQDAFCRLDTSEGHISRRQRATEDETTCDLSAPTFGDLSRLPLLAFFPPERGSVGLDRPASGAPRGPLRAWHGAFPAPGADIFQGFVPWFRDQENAENELRLHQDPAARLPALACVRRALRTFLSAVSIEDIGEPRVMRLDSQGKTLPQGELAFPKGSHPLRLSQFSDGERQLLLLVGELARRLAIANPGAAEPLLGDGVILIDEIELHLHPGWQRKILPALAETFPNLQIVATTHSPQVLASVPGSAVRVIDDFQIYTAPPTLGRDSNSLLEEVMGDTPRPQKYLDALARVSDLLDEGRYPAARSALDRLAAELTSDDADIQRFHAMLAFLEE